MKFYLIPGSYYVYKVLVGFSMFLEKMLDLPRIRKIRNFKSRFSSANIDFRTIFLSILFKSLLIGYKNLRCSIFASTKVCVANSSRFLVNLWPNLFENSSNSVGARYHLFYAPTGKLGNGYRIRDVLKILSLGKCSIGINWKSTVLHHTVLLAHYYIYPCKYDIITPTPYLASNC